MTDVSRELTSLHQMTTSELCERYLKLFGQPVRTRHKAYLIRKLAWRIQALAEGDLSDRARRRAQELAQDADIRLMPPKETSRAAPHSVGETRLIKAPARKDSRLPAPGTAIVREYKGRTIRLLVRSEGFDYDGLRYKTLTAVCVLPGGGAALQAGDRARCIAAASPVVQPADEWLPAENVFLIESDSDHWKSWVHQRLATPVNNAGAMTLFQANPQEHMALAKHLTAEVKTEEFVAGKGMVMKWERLRRQNHWLDALYNASAAAHGCGVRLAQEEVTTFSGKATF